MRIARQIVVFDAADLAAASTFWAALLGGTVDADDDWHTVCVDGEPRLGVQLAPNHVPPESRSHAASLLDELWCRRALDGIGAALTDAA